MRPIHIFGGLAALLAGGAAAGALVYRSEKKAETPSYELLKIEGRFELRQYDPMIVAETIEPGAHDAAVSAGFKRLADYIFAKSRPGEKLAMTAPVTSSSAGAPGTPAPRDADAIERAMGSAQGRWAVRFVMPSIYRKSTLPPAGDEIAIEQVGERVVAVAKLDGTPSEAHWADATEKLLYWIESIGRTPAGPPEYASYNSPFIPAPLRRDEVIIPVSDPA